MLPSKPPGTGSWFQRLKGPRSSLSVRQMTGRGPPRYIMLWTVTRPRLYADHTRSPFSPPILLCLGCSCESSVPTL